MNKENENKSKKRWGKAQIKENLPAKPKKSNFPPPSNKSKGNHHHGEASAMPLSVTNYQPTKNKHFEAKKEGRG